jgi:GNAT superfamily N-acetyltransferase
MVSSRCRREGIARTLMMFAERRARDLGYVAIRLDAFVHNPGALRLYQGLGCFDAGGVMLREGPFRCFEKKLQAADDAY